VEEIAARFGCSPHTVRQRLRLAAVSPVLLQAYRDGALTLDHLTAFTVTEDQAAKERAYEGLQEWQRHPDAIRRLLTQALLPATDRRVTFAGLDAYLAAGGTVRRDLFSEDGGGWIADAGLLERLVGERIAREAAAIQAEGWAWVAIGPDAQAEAWRCRRVWPGKADLSEADEGRRTDLASRYDELAAKHNGSADDLPEDVAAELDRIEAELAALEARKQAWRPEPELALRAMLHALATDAFYTRYADTVARFTSYLPNLAAACPGIADSPARQGMMQAEADWRGRLPKRQADLWAWLQEQDTPALLGFLAVCVARTADAGRADWTTPHGAEIIQARAATAAGLDMRQCWTATKESYLSMVPKALILEAVRDGAGSSAAGPPCRDQEGGHGRGRCGAAGRHGVAAGGAVRSRGDISRGLWRGRGPGRYAGGDGGGVARPVPSSPLARLGPPLPGRPLFVRHPRSKNRVLPGSLRPAPCPALAGPCASARPRQAPMP